MAKTKAPGITYFINLFSFLLILGSLFSLPLALGSASKGNEALFTIHIVFVVTGFATSLLLMGIAQIIYQLQVLIDK